MFKFAIAANAVSVLLSRNHMSGDVAPGNYDKIATKLLVATGELVGIPALDCIHRRTTK